jgi:hypothetical protein
MKDNICAKLYLQKHTYMHIYQIKHTPSCTEKSIKENQSELNPGPCIIWILEPLMKDFRDAGRVRMHGPKNNNIRTTTMKLRKGRTSKN